MPPPVGMRCRPGGWLLSSELAKGHQPGGCGAGGKTCVEPFPQLIGTEGLDGGAGVLLPEQDLPLRPVEDVAAADQEVGSMGAQIPEGTRSPRRMVDDQPGMVAQKGLEKLPIAELTSGVSCIEGDGRLDGLVGLGGRNG